VILTLTASAVHALVFIPVLRIIARSPAIGSSDNKGAICGRKRGPCPVRLGGFTGGYPCRCNSRSCAREPSLIMCGPFLLASFVQCNWQRHQLFPVALEPDFAQLYKSVPRDNFFVFEKKDAAGAARSSNVCSTMMKRMSVYALRPGPIRRRLT